MRSGVVSRWSKIFAARRLATEKKAIELSIEEQQMLLDDIQREFRKAEGNGKGQVV